MHIGTFKAHETILLCRNCGKIYRPKEIDQIVPRSANFAYDIMIYVGKELFLNHVADQTIIEKLNSKNINISASEIAYLGKKFIVYLTLAHKRSAPKIKNTMNQKGGYILHLDSTYEDKSPLLMIGMDSIMQIVLGNIKLPSEKSDDIIPFLENINELFGTPIAVVHDMSKGIIKAVNKVFPSSHDFICHFHFLRDIGKDVLGPEYDNIRKILKEHRITYKLNKRLRSFKQSIDQSKGLINIMIDYDSIDDFPKELNKNIPIFAAYSLVHWALEGKKQGNGYGFPFDRPYLELTERLKIIFSELQQLLKINVYNDSKVNEPIYKTLNDLETIIDNKKLWQEVNKLKLEIEIFEDLREAMRISPKSSKKGLNHDGGNYSIYTIKDGVTQFKKQIIGMKEFSKNKKYQKMLDQIDKYHEKLFADPIEVETIEGVKQIQPQRTNNILEREIRDLKRGYRQKSGSNALGKKLRAMLTNTPLVKNLKNDEYMDILLDGKLTLEELFAEIDINAVRAEYKIAQYNPEKMPAKLIKLISEATYPERLKKIIKRIFEKEDSNSK